MGCERLLAYIIPVSAALPHDYFPVLLMLRLGMTNDQNRQRLPMLAYCI